MPDINTVVVTPTVSVVAVNSSVPGSYDSVARLGLGWFNVVEYGAKGDGVTDDTTAIQAAFTAAGSGAVVLFPPGDYLVTALTLSNSNVTVVGPGATLVGSGSSLPLTISGDDNCLEGFTVNTTGTSHEKSIVVSGDGNRLRRLRFVGDATDGTNNGRVEVSGDDASLAECTHTGTNVAVAISGNRAAVVRGTFESYRTGVYLAGGAGHTIAGNWFVSIAGSGIVAGMDAVVVEATTDSDISGNVIFAAREHGIYIANGSTPNARITVARNRVRGVGADCIKVLAITSNHTTDLAIVGNIVGTSSATSVGIRVGSCEDVVVAGNVAKGLNYGLYVYGDVHRLNVVGGDYIGNTAGGIRINDFAAANEGLYFSGVTVSGNDTASGGFNGIDVILANGFASKDFVFWNISGSDQQGSPTQGVTLSIAAPTGGSTLDGVSAGSITGYNNTSTPATSISTSTSITNVSLFGSGFDSARTENSTYTVKDTDSVIRSDATGGGVAHNLPTAVGRNGKRFTSVKLDSSVNAVVVDPASTQTINGASTYVLRAQYQWVEYQSDGTNWVVINAGRYESAWASKSGGYTVTDGDAGLFLAGSGATLTLQGAATRTRPLILRSIASGSWTIARAGSDTIEGGTSISLSAGANATLMPNGTDWLVVA